MRKYIFFFIAKIISNFALKLLYNFINNYCLQSPSYDSLNTSGMMIIDLIRLIFLRCAGREVECGHASEHILARGQLNNNSLRNSAV